MYQAPGEDLLGRSMTLWCPASLDIDLLKEVAAELLGAGGREKHEGPIETSDGPLCHN